MKNKHLFPLFLDLTEKKVVVIGAGRIAARRVNTLLPFAGDIVVVAPKADPAVCRLAEEGKIRYESRAYEREDLYEADLVLAATDDHKLNEEIYSVCKCLGITVNVASDRNKCDFHFPGIVLKQEIVIGINAGGEHHRAAKEMREKIQKFLDDEP